MSRRALVILAVVLLLIAGGVIVWTQFLHGGSRAVHTAVVERRAELSATVRATGKVDIATRLPIPMTQPGTIRLIAANVGDSVRTGDILAVLDDTRQRQDVQAATDALDAAQYGLTSARERSAGDASGRSAIVGAEAAVQDAQRKLDTARDALRRTLILAPIDGTVLSVSVVERASYNTGQEIMQIANLSNLILSVDLDELDVPRLGDNRTANVTFDAFPGQQAQGTLAAISPVATNRNGRTVYVGTVTFAKPPALDLRPGMGADVSIPTRTERNALVVPDLAVETIGAKTFVTVLHDDGTRERVEVKTGLRANGLVQIASGVSEGTRVVVP